MPRLVRVFFALASVGAIVGLTQCRSPTEVTLVLSTDTDCAHYTGTSITLGPPGAVEGVAPLTVTTACPQGRSIGTFVVAPPGDKNARFEVRIVTGITAKPEDCAPPGQPGDYKGCIVARRIMTYVAHTPLELPIEMLLDCENQPCDVNTTCVNASCVSAVVPDPGSCSSPGACDFSDGSSPVDAAVDTTLDASDASDADATCLPSSCQAEGYACGIHKDTCGNAQNCGNCEPPATVCNAMSQCVPTDGGTDACVTCTAQGIECGPYFDTCGKAENCGNCSPGATTCMSNQCVPVDGGPDSCVPESCQQQGVACGNAIDTCGNPEDCGNCTPGITTCVNNNCVPVDGGSDACVPLLCGQNGIECGTASDQCGGMLFCGSCSPPDVCDFSTNKCCTSCMGQGYACGSYTDSCGNVTNCGTCMLPQTCDMGTHQCVAPDAGPDGEVDPNEASEITCIMNKCGPMFAPEATLLVAQAGANPCYCSSCASACGGVCPFNPGSQLPQCIDCIVDDPGGCGVLPCMPFATPVTERTVGGGGTPDGAPPPPDGGSPDGGLPDGGAMGCKNLIDCINSVCGTP